jgi:hypothetical protein
MSGRERRFGPPSVGVEVEEELGTTRDVLSGYSDRLPSNWSEPTNVRSPFLCFAGRTGDRNDLAMAGARVLSELLAERLSDASRGADPFPEGFTGPAGAWICQNRTVILASP